MNMARNTFLIVYIPCLSCLPTSLARRGHTAFLALLFIIYKNNRPPYWQSHYNRLSLGWQLRKSQEISASPGKRGTSSSAGKQVYWNDTANSNPVRHYDCDDTVFTSLPARAGAGGEDQSPFRCDSHHQSGCGGCGRAQMDGRPLREL